MKQSADEVLALLAEHGGRIFALLIRLTLRTDVAEDLMQELFCNLARSDSFRQARDPYAYAISAATNLAFAYRRSRQRLRLADVPVADVDCADSQTDDSGVLANLVEREEFERVLAALESLPSAAREIVVWRYLEQEDFEMIATRLGKSTHQVRALCYKGIVRLRQLLADVSIVERQATSGRVK